MTWWFNPDTDAYEPVMVLDHQEQAVTILRAGGQYLQVKESEMMVTPNREYLRNFFGEDFTNDRGHVWQKDGDETDFLAFDADDEDGKGHNGPTCVKCGYSFCVHCHDGPQEDCTGKVTRE